MHRGDLVLDTMALGIGYHPLERTRGTGTATVDKGIERARSDRLEVETN